LRTQSLSYADKKQLFIHVLFWLQQILLLIILSEFSCWRCDCNWHEYLGKFVKIPWQYLASLYLLIKNHGKLCLRDLELFLVFSLWFWNEVKFKFEKAKGATKYEIAKSQNNGPTVILHSWENCGFITKTGSKWQFVEISHRSKMIFHIWY
jgi:hypothetical protein